MTSRYSRKVVQRQSIPASIAAPEISSARSRFRTTRARPDFDLGAKVKPQLPMTTVVTPCQHHEDPKGFQCIWASRWVCTSMKPGDRKSVVKGKRVSVRVDVGGRRDIKKKIKR